MLVFDLVQFTTLVKPFNTTRYWEMLEALFLLMLSSLESKIFQRCSHVHSICYSRDNFWVTSDPVVDNVNNIDFWIIDLLLVKLKWWQILSLTWLLCAISKEKMNLWVTCDHLVFKGYNLKWTNTRSMFYNVIVLDHMFYSTTIYALYKIQTPCFRKQFLSLAQHKYRPQARQDKNDLWSVPSFSQKLHRMRFLLNSGMCDGISFGSDGSSVFHFLVLLKGKDRCQLLYLQMNDFATPI